MPRYIDADNIIAILTQEYGYSVATLPIKEIKKAPTADVQPVKHGHWVNCKAGFYHSFVECSECGHFTTMKHNYCPNCGCRMVDPQESEDT